LGGLAGIYYGSARVTYDIDICYALDDANLEALAKLLKEIKAELRGEPSGLPFRIEAQTFRAGLNFTFKTRLGELDVLGEVAGVGGYDECMAGAKFGNVAGQEVAILSLENLIAAKKAAARPKDLGDLQILEVLLNAKKNLPNA